MVPVAEFVCAPPLEKTVFGSVISAVLLAVPPLWHAAREAIDPSTINPTVRATSFRIRNDSRKNCGCKPVFEQAIKPAIAKCVVLERLCAEVIVQAQRRLYRQLTTSLSEF
ncbi:MAG TPA: hypothetical protein VKH45_10505 [Candidatus Acidoferrum sp.]|nr:hypothetical protein [Candidatus Acidoferrum sp.]